MDHPKYVEMRLWSLQKIEEHIKTCLGTRADGRCVAGQNALAMAKHDERHECWKQKCRQTKSTVSGVTRNPRDKLAIAFGIMLGTHDEFGKHKD